MLNGVVDKNKEIARLYDKNGDYVGNAYVHTKIKDGVKCIIVESDGRTNPAEYVTSIFEFLKPILSSDKNVSVYLDLANFYGINNKSWLYEWIFKINNDNQLVETGFIRIDKWSKISNKTAYTILQDYLFNKFSHKFYH
ncbi:hypothetical protein M972_112772 [Acetivibrio thermocellus AD2]|uniref:Transposase n=1 Tax=Acetivibrio thermocellus AD2 TaxID=1138384 RepID=A0AB36TJK8_ACETH|nr:hypothetical protein [Acetivibrio thermocellus]ALX09670.1 hypothetical protein AD2_02690 [Acetivibrio thermocellus AD2]ANV77443.1 hypothetical protein LQRI_2702 [Acetivibrio thermocellus DSM 2360]EIC03566.1 hypothetical protein YSBL_2768 [Acetivibrio thermocellus YS]PFH03953.1 hypothetical protein M972_112772 [Acetivibrio thermocellus AD2]SOD22811.1 hypothetical protein SAMN04515622_0823 [Acetivibrio thermocellus]